MPSGAEAAFYMFTSRVLESAWLRTEDIIEKTPSSQIITKRVFGGFVLFYFVSRASACKEIPTVVIFVRCMLPSAFHSSSGVFLHRMEGHHAESGSEGRGRGTVLIL